jgi:hypothetical protein
VTGTETARSVVQKAVVAVCSQPIYTALLPSLDGCTKDYFARGFDKEVLHKYFETVNSTLASLQPRQRWLTGGFVIPTSDI